MDGPASQETVNNVATGEPEIDGTAEVGETLTATTSNIADADGMTNAVFTYQWKRVDPASSETEGENIPGATAQTYVVTSDDVDKALWVVVSFTDDADNAESIPSARHTASPATAQQEEPVNSVATGEPGIDGTLRVGSTLTATTSNIADADGMTDAVFTYQWKRIDPASTDTDGEEHHRRHGTDLRRDLRRR